LDIIPDTLENHLIKHDFDSYGRMVSCFDKTDNRIIVDEKEPANQLISYEDIPLFWDAWDLEIYYLEKPTLEHERLRARIHEESDISVSLKVEDSICSNSKFTQIVTLDLQMLIVILVLFVLNMHLFRIKEPGKQPIFYNKLIPSNFNIPSIINNPPFMKTAFSMDCIFKLNNPSFIIETAKLVEDGSNSIVLKVYEAYAGRESVILSWSENLEVKKIYLCNPLEDDLVSFPFNKTDSRLDIWLSPFQIETLRFLI
ncbi:hypothetical protein ROZALSC1DRAFT_25899, partial [Rozella allomycis CSF55]